MSRIIDVIKNKNKVEKALKRKRKNEITTLKDKAAFKARLYDELSHLEVILDDKDIESVIVEVPDKSLSAFNAAIYSEDLAGYDIKQSNDSPNKFYIKRRYINY